MRYPGHPAGYLSKEADRRHSGGVKGIFRDTDYEFKAVDGKRQVQCREKAVCRFYLLDVGVFMCLRILQRVSLDKNGFASFVYLTTRCKRRVL